MNDVFATILYRKPTTEKLRETVGLFCFVKIFNPAGFEIRSTEFSQRGQKLTNEWEERSRLKVVFVKFKIISFFEESDDWLHLTNDGKINNYNSLLIKKTYKRAGPLSILQEQKAVLFKLCIF